jgi:hypothetical protein
MPRNIVMNRSASELNDMLNQRPTTAASATTTTTSNSSSINTDSGSNTNPNTGSDEVVLSKPKKPRLALSAYRIFYQVQQEQMLYGTTTSSSNMEETIANVVIMTGTNTRTTRKQREIHGKIAYPDLANTIARQWNVLDATLKLLYEKYAAIDKQRFIHDKNEYNRREELWQQRQQQQQQQQHMIQHSQHNLQSQLLVIVDVNRHRRQ